MRKLFIVALTVLCCGLNSVSWAKGGDLLVISYFPEKGVYDKDTLLDLVTKTERLLSIRDDRQQPLFESIDGLSTENIIVSQGDQVRFRRLVEKREMTPTGLQTLKSLVNTHPLLHDKLADHDGKQLHLWLRLNSTLSSDQSAPIFDQVMQVLDNTNQCLRQQANGALRQGVYEEWSLETDNKNLSDIYQSLSSLTETSQENSLVAYSATDLIGYLKQSMLQQLVNMKDSSEIEQLYMIAESVRSRHLHDLASPNFQKLKIVRMKSGRYKDLETSFFQSQLIRRWQASDQTYQVLDCRQPS